jgi:nitrous oxide reductase accessory protein NosL
MIMAICLSLTGIGLAQEDIKKHPSCKYCGMDREKFAFSRMLIEYDDGTTEGTCSLHCMAVELALKIDKTPKAILVGDLNTRALIDVEKGFWVIGGKKMGIMTKRGKWAFAKKEDADKFKAENGGDSTTFDLAVKAAYEDMDADAKMIRDRRKMRQKTMEHKH